MDGRYAAPDQRPGQALRQALKKQQHWLRRIKEMHGVRMRSNSGQWLQSEAQAGGFALQIAYGTGAYLRFVMILGVLHECFAFGEDGVDESGELMGGGGDGVAGTQASGEAAVVGPECALTALQSLCGELEGTGDAIGDALGGARQALAAGDAGTGAQPQPGGEALGGGEFAQIRTHLGQD